MLNLTYVTQGPTAQTIHGSELSNVGFLSIVEVDMKKISLGRNRLVAVVSDMDYEGLSCQKWHALRSSRNGRTRCFYAARKQTQKEPTPRKYCWMHRVIMGDKEGCVVDHINGDTLDNRRVNLRFITHVENLRNSGPRNNKQYKGVYSEGRGWYSALTINGETKRLGTYHNPQDAAYAYDQALEKEGLVNAWRNFPTKSQLMRQQQLDKTLDTSEEI